MPALGVLSGKPVLMHASEKEGRAGFASARQSFRSWSRAGCRPKGVPNARLLFQPLALKSFMGLRPRR